jgi:hypothetical protein
MMFKSNQSNDWHPPKKLQVVASKRTFSTPEPFVFTKNDVLFTVSDGDNISKYSLIDYVGNRRFMVLLNIYRPKYSHADVQGDEAECARIALEIVNTVCQQCVPQGKFFLRDLNNAWHQLTDSLVDVVQGIITNVAPSFPSDVKQSSKRASCTSSKNLDLVCHPDSLISTPKPFDVICNSNLVTLKSNSNHVGNNRLQIILDARTSAFETASQDERNRIINQIVSIIIDDSSSQFLAKDGESKKYAPLTRTSAAVCVKNALASKKLVTTNKLRICGSEANRLVHRYYKTRMLHKQERRSNIFLIG